MHRPDTEPHMGDLRTAIIVSVVITIVLGGFYMLAGLGAAMTGNSDIVFFWFDILGAAWIILIMLVWIGYFLSRIRRPKRDFRHGVHKR